MSLTKPQFIESIHCPYHEDNTASLAIYDDGNFRCYGCLKTGRASELGIKTERKQRYVTDLRKEILRIKTLPHKTIRGFLLPYDDVRYYLVWPSGEYFVARYFEKQQGRGKYHYPSGHTRPLLTFNDSIPDALSCIVIEGEFNAFSVNAVLPDYPIVCAGSSSNFRKCINAVDKFKTVHIVADQDKAGAVGAIELANALRAQGKLAFIHLMREDANQVLVEYGKDKLKEIITKAVF